MDAAAQAGLGECSNCGAAVRENTFFCYNCGQKIAADVDKKTVDESEARAALSAIAEKIEEDEKGSKCLEAAAKERKRSRATKRKKTEIIWEPEPGRSNIFIAAVTILIALLAFVTVFMMVIWK
jgi:uncharacterized membrane protein YvbJ